MKKLLTAEFFATNRQRAMGLLEGSVLVASAYGAMQRSHDAAFRFEQEANFWYLTGIERAGWWLILDATRGKSWLVSPGVDPVHALFDGEITPEQAMQVSGVDEVITRNAANDLLAQIARQHRLVYTIDQPGRAEAFEFTLNPAMREMRERLARQFADVQDFRPTLAKLRAIKQPVEVKVIESAIDLTVRTLQDVHEKFATYKHEYEVEADITSGFRRAGAVGHAYDPIVAAGSNACTLHYVENNARLSKKSLVLLDVGAQVEHYAADITRTYAYSEPTKRQRAVHAAVQSAHRDIIDLLRPGLDVRQYSEQADMRMKQALIELDLVDSPDSEQYRTYFPHAISHGLGVDVHDSLGAPTEFRPGMLLTVEPGIYIPEEGIGVRIEDDILITDSGHRNLSKKLSSRL